MVVVIEGKWWFLKGFKDLSMALDIEFNNRRRGKSYGKYK